MTLARSLRLCRRCNVVVLVVGAVLLAASTRLLARSSPPTPPTSPTPTPTPRAQPQGLEPRLVGAARVFDRLDVPPFTILDATSFTSTACLMQLAAAPSEPTSWWSWSWWWGPAATETPASAWCPLPFQSWLDVVTPAMRRRDDDVGGPPPAVPCDAMTPRCAQFATAPGTVPSAFTCAALDGDEDGDEDGDGDGGGGAGKGGPRTVTCYLTENLRAGPSAAAVVVSHVGVSSPGLYDNRERMHRMLFPLERTLANQVWALKVMYESATYYPAGADASVLAQFNYTFGSGRDKLMGFRMSYMPDWTALAAPLDLAGKETAAQSLRRQAPVVWVTSNCRSRSGREEYVQGLMRELAIDSFGRCLNNRDPGEFGLKPDHSNWVSSLVSKHRLLFAYKFALVIENSLDYDYVTEKIFDAWEAQAVPLYLGAPNIDQYAPGPHSFIDLRNMSHAAVAALVRDLDADPAKYQEYHAWRFGGLDAVKASSPLGATLAEHDAAEPMCHICRLAHRAKRNLTT